MMARWAVRLALLRRVPDQYEFHPHRQIRIRREQRHHLSRQPGHLPPAQARQRQTTQLRRRRRAGVQERPAADLVRAIGEHLLDRWQVAHILRQ